MERAKRISPEEARKQLHEGDALLVCAYDDEKQCKEMRLNGSISLAEFERKVPLLPKNKDIIFYCA